MKKHLLTVAALAALTLPAATAQAQDIAFQPYVGFDLMHVRADYRSEDLGGGTTLDYGTMIEDSFNGLHLHVGNRFHRHFGVELGYFRTREEDKNVAAGTALGTGLVAAAPFSSSVQLSGFTLDALGYLPFGAAERVSLVGTAGIGWTKADLEATVPGLGTVSDDESEFGFRLGGGAEFALTDNISIRGLARWQQADFDDTVDDLWTYNLGVNFSF